MVNFEFFLGLDFPSFQIRCLDIWRRKKSTLSKIEEQQAAHTQPRPSLSMLSISNPNTVSKPGSGRSTCGSQSADHLGTLPPWKSAEKWRSYGHTRAPHGHALTRKSVPPARNSAKIQNFSKILALFSRYSPVWARYKYFVSTFIS